MSQLTSCLIAKVSASSRPFSAPLKVLAELNRDPRLFKQTWVRRAAAALLATSVANTIQHKGQDKPQPDYVATPPWQTPFAVEQTWLHSPKANFHPAILRGETLTHLLPLTDSHTTTIYTDGSVNPETGAAGAAFITEDVSRQWRLTDVASSTQTELVAIREAFQHLTTTIPPSALIATDSKAALQAIQHPWPQNNVNLITHIRSLASRLREWGTHITFTWIPGHAQIHGNECADEASRHATRRPDPDITIYPSMAQIKQKIKTQVKHLHSAEHANEVANGSPSAT
ncbi:Gag-Pol polyprotein [Portunus trituberculatus]|uniref:ribonuclease H n=1 Tax=Portunus trituberculatus TaxID=210409 RepID=A0A5B7IKR0_PORTR|nr:Gag-Pol polyprotein [Portunus trituberculatus]